VTTENDDVTTVYERQLVVDDGGDGGAAAAPTVPSSFYPPSRPAVPSAAPSLPRGQGPRRLQTTAAANASKCSLDVSIAVAIDFPASAITAAVEKYSDRIDASLSTNDAFAAVISLLEAEAMANVTASTVDDALIAGNASASGEKCNSTSSVVKGKSAVIVVVRRAAAADPRIPAWGVALICAAATCGCCCAGGAVAYRRRRRDGSRKTIRLAFSDGHQRVVVAEGPDLSGVFVAAETEFRETAPVGYASASPPRLILRGRELSPKTPIEDVGSGAVLLVRGEDEAADETFCAAASPAADCGRAQRSLPASSASSPVRAAEAAAPAGCCSPPSQQQQQQQPIIAPQPLDTQAVDDFFDAAARGDDAFIASALSALPSLARAVRSDGVTAAHVAARSGKAAALSLLLERGADAAAADVRGLTILHHAALAKSATVARVAIARGAPLSALDAAGRGPIEVAVLAQAAEVAELLRSSQAAPKSSQESRNDAIYSDNLD
jgi:hypothetical protein